MRNFKLRCFIAAAFALIVGVCLAGPIKLTCWIVEGDQGTAFSTTQVSNLVSDVNTIFKQVVLSFEIESLQITNCNALSTIDRANITQITNLCNISRNTRGLELYFVNKIRGSSVAFSLNLGTVISANADLRAISHEIGHACGLSDIFVENEDEMLFVTGLPSKDRMPDDWGWYPRYVGQNDIIKRLLMYGVTDSSGVDISYGDIHGVYYTNIWNRATREWNRVWCEGPAPVGFERHGKRSPRSL